MVVSGPNFVRVSTASPQPYALPTRATGGLIAALTGLVMLGQMATSIYVPSLPYIDDALDADPSLVKLTMTVFLWAFALSQLVYGPLSDRYGRRPVLVGGIAIYLAGSAVCALASSIDTLIVGRALQGVGACAGTAIYRAVVRDLFDLAEGARVLAALGIAFAAAPALGPIIGGELQVRYGWQAGFVFLIGLGVVVAVAVALRLPESNRRLDPTATRPLQIFRNYRTLLSSRLFWGYCLIVGWQFGGVMAYTTGLPFVMIDLHGMEADQFGYLFLFSVFGFFIGALLANFLLSRHVAPDRLMVAGSLFQIVASGAMFALAQTMPTPAMIIGPQILFMVGFGLIMPIALASALEPFPAIAGTASALLGFFQMAFAGLAIVLLAALYDETARPMAALILVSAVVSAVALFTLVRPARA